MTMQYRDNRGGRGGPQYGGNRDGYRGGGRREFKPKPPRVTEPTEIDVVSNLFKYTGQPLHLYQYTVSITPEVKKAYMFRKFMAIAEYNKFEENFCFDGYNTLVTDKKFTDLELEYPLKGEGEGVMKCKIEFRDAFKLEDKSDGLIQCLDIITKFHQKKNYYVDKRKMIMPMSKPYPLEMGLQIIPGLISNFMFNIDGLYLNLDTIFGVFYKPQPLIDFCEEMLRTSQRYGDLNSGFSPEMCSHMERMIKKLKLRTTHRGERNKTFTAFGLTTGETALTKMIEFEDKTRMSVADYFSKQYKPLQYPRLPLVIFRGRNKSEIHMPIEVLTIVEMQKYSPRLNE